MNRVSLNEKNITTIKFLINGEQLSRLQFKSCESKKNL